MRILIVEDQKEVQAAVAKRLRAQGYSVDTAGNLADAELQLKLHEYSVLVLDRMLPDGDSIDSLDEWRRGGVQTPVLFLTALDEITDRVAGLEAGADDYLVKPFAMDELIARLVSIARRGTSQTPSTFVLHDLEIDLSRRQARRQKVLLPLRPKEYSVLEYLAIQKGRTVSRDELRQACWDESRSSHSNVEEAVIAALRRKLGKPDLIHTVRGFGWVLEEPASAQDPKSQLPPTLE